MYAQQISVRDNFTNMSLKEDKSRLANFHATFPNKVRLENTSFSSFKWATHEYGAQHQLTDHLSSASIASRNVIFQW